MDIYCFWFILFCYDPRRNIPVTNGEELTPSIDKIYEKYCNRKKEGKERKELKMCAAQYQYRVHI
jgi:hypothetical protein